MSFEELVNRIVSSCPGVSRQSLMERLEAERRRAGGLISDEALLRLIAARLGCDVGAGVSPPPSLLLRDLIPGLSDITVAGRVVAMFSPRAFKGGRKGRFASLLLADESGMVRVVLWNDKAGLAEPGGLRVSSVVRFRHGYTREDLGGRVEVHMGERCTVEVDPVDVRSGDYPSVGRFVTRIGDLGAAAKRDRVSLAGEVKRLGSVSEFERADGGSGKVVRFVLSDGSGDVAVVVWNEKVDEVEGLLRVGAGLQVVNARLKGAAGGGVEVHVDGATYVAAQSFSEFSSLASLREGSAGVDVAGEVVTAPMLRDVKTARQGVLRVAAFELRDESGRMWVSAWRGHADSVKDLKVGDRVVIRNAYVRRGFGDELELSTRSGTSIVKQAEKPG